MKLLLLILIAYSTTFANLDLGVRYLKLANTYREANEFNKAEEFLDKGKKLVNVGYKWENKYWTAVADEYYAYLYNDLSKIQNDESNRNYFKQLSIEHFNKAKNEYNKLVKMDDGSQEALTEIIENVKSLDKKFSSVGKNSKNSYNNLENVLNYDRLKLRELPVGISENAENLSLSENKFREFPPGLSRFSNLQYLNLSDNNIKSISQDIEQLRNLKWLDLSDNKLKELPVNICNLQNLEELDLMNNKLKSLPASICQMQNLKILNLKNNDLPYQEIANLIKCLPNTNIFLDEYKLVDKKKETAIPSE